MTSERPPLAIRLLTRLAQASVLNADRLADAGLSSLAGLVNLDASVQDSYNATGYVSYLKVRGFDLDNRFNYRRDGLPINAETALLDYDLVSALKAWDSRIQE